jgi:hypothetical protein
MIVTVLAMRMVQLAAYEVIDMVTMRYGFVPAVWTVLMRATGFRGAPHGIFGADRNHMFVDVILMHVVKMAVVKIVHMAIMANRGCPQSGPCLWAWLGWCFSVQVVMILFPLSRI